MTIKVNSQSNNEVIAVGIQGPPGSSFISVESIQNVDTTTKIDGSILVYKTITNKWTSTTTLDAQDMEGGHY